MARISRRKLASYISSRIANGERVQLVLRELAAFLIESGRKKELELIVRDIETALVEKGAIVATATSARPLATEAKKQLETLIKMEYANVTQVVLRESIDESLIGGVRLELPGKQFDASVKTKLEKLTV